MRYIRTAFGALVACALLASSAVAQNSGAGLGLGLLDRYLEALRVELGIPGLSAVVVEDGRTVFERSYGLADITANLAARPDTPFPLGGLTEVFGSGLTLSTCVDSGRGTIADRVVRWTPFAEPTTTIGHLLTHVLPGGVYQYDPGRFSTLTAVAAECADDDFDTLLANDVFDRFAMTDAVPGRDATAPVRRGHFTPSQLDRYANALRRVAVPYRLDAKRTPVRSDDVQVGVDASTGVIASARDLARYTSAADEGLLLSPALLAQSYTAQIGQPTGLGWFVQPYNGQRIVWQFGMMADAYSSLIVKIPDRRLTLILLANSDALTSAITPQAPDVTQSLFARTFLRLFIS